MQFENIDIEKLLNESQSFSLEGFNIFYIGKDNLPHIVCTCPDKSTAKAIYGLLEIAKKAREMPVRDAAYITCETYLSPQVLANGNTALVATMLLFDKPLDADDDEIEIGSPEYETFIEKLRSRQS